MAFKRLGETFFTISITTAACLFSKGVMRRLFLSSIIGACCGILVNIIGGELLRLEFIMQIQAWRCSGFFNLFLPSVRPCLLLILLNLGGKQIIALFVFCPYLVLLFLRCNQFWNNAYILISFCAGIKKRFASCQDYCGPLFF